MENSSITSQNNSIEQEPALESTEAGDFNGMSASYSPDDNKLRLYVTSRLDAETYARVKAAGFAWAPKQKLFVAGMWTPGREDLLLDLCEEIGDEDTSLAERAEERADRFQDYSSKRTKEARQASDAVAQIAEGIPFGQPILVGHHSERRARKDAERIENGMRRAVRLWDTASYWTSRAAGAIRHSRYVERSDVRARRIRKIEADQRKAQRNHDDASQQMKAWNFEGMSRELALAIANRGHVSACFALAEYPRELPASQYEGSMSLWSALRDGIVTPEQARVIALDAYGKTLAWAARWIAHYSLRLSYERAMLDEKGGTVAAKTGPEKGGAVQCWAAPRGGWAWICKVNKISVTIEDNWGRGSGNFTRTIPFDKLARIMTAADVATARAEGCLHETPDGVGFFLQDREPESITEAAPTQVLANDAAETEGVDDAGMAAALRERLSEGVQVAVAPQLFPTPVALAERMVELANIEAGMDVLEPSAGTGAILDAVQRLAPAVQLQAVEIHRGLVECLRGAGYLVTQGDFLACGPELGQFDRILLNPPFADATDIAHVLRARSLLKPGGLLVAICANGPRQNARLRPLVEGSGGQWIPLPVDTFKQQGTGVRTVLLTLFAE
jgi:hypothetical protein